MRIVSDRLKGRSIRAPKNLPVRPTTDFAKEAMFNVLQNEIDFEQESFLDLFCGTGNISYEMASRGCNEILALDQSPACVRFVKETFRSLEIKGRVQQQDVLRFLNRNSHESYSLIFADPPYQMEGIENIPTKILENSWLKSGGQFILEHSAKLDFNEQKGFRESRKYGHVNFSFFEYI